jgi:acetolactate synthase-1/2/3 large subunit
MLKSKNGVERRKFLKGAAVGGMATIAANAGALGAQPFLAPQARPAEAETNASGAEVLTVDRPGSDFMVDVIKSLGFEYLAANPGSSFRGLHESLITYGGNKSPEFLTCCHEESSVALAHGYAEVEGKPMLVLAHSTVGLQHAAMAIYNAWGGRVPVYIILGNSLDATQRRPGVEWYHSAQDAAAMVRDYTKWDDTPMSLPHFAESAVRAYKIAMTPPFDPVAIVADGALQEEPISEKNLRIPKLVMSAPPQGEIAAVKQAAKMLVDAENPVIVAGRVARTPKGIELLVELAETLQAPVMDQRLRMNFPTRHPLAGRPSLTNADVILSLETQDLWSSLNSQTGLNKFGMESHRTANGKLIDISAVELNYRSNYQDFGHYLEPALSITGDCEATLPSLIEEVKRQLTDDRKRLSADRGAKLALLFLGPARELVGRHDLAGQADLLARGVPAEVARRPR